jgi:hypothetical protein
MTALTHADEPPYTDRTGPSPPRWEFPEVAAVVVLAAVGVLAVGGIAAGIVESQRNLGTSAPPGFDRQLLGGSLVAGSSWASLVVGIVLLGLVGLCWWNVGQWEPDGDDVDPESDDVEALGHIGRCRAITVWIQVVLGVTALAAVADFVGGVIEHFDGVDWAPNVDAGANMLAVLAVAGTGVVLGRRLTNRYAADEA